MRARGRWLVRAAAAGGVLALMGCGGGSGPPSAAEFGKSPDALCASAEAFDSSLPRLQQTQHLTADELAARANQEAESFRSSVARLTPPPAMSAADHTLIADLGDHPPSTPSTPTAALIARLEKHSRALLSDYTALGATGCAAFERRGIAALQAIRPQRG